MVGGNLDTTIFTIAEWFKEIGYNTAAFGKWHETATWEVSVSGPFTRWPTNSGFDKFYGFIQKKNNVTVTHTYKN